MAWIRLDDKRALNLKLTAAGFAARGLDEAAICLAGSLETDGKITHTMLAALAASHGTTGRGATALAKTLVDVGRWEPAEDGWMIHDYLEYNPSRVQARATRDEVSKARSVAGQRGGRRSGEARREAKAKQKDVNQTEATDMKQTKPRPDPSASNEAETGRDALPPEGRRPPRQTQTPQPGGSTVAATQERRDADLAKAEACGKCDHGWITIDGREAKCACQNGNHP